MEKSYYEILGLEKNCTKEDLSKAKKELSKKYHPDKLPAGQREHGTKMLQQINEAYDILNDDSKKEIYDRYGKEGLNGQPQKNPFGGQGFPFGGDSPFGHMPFNMFNGHQQQQHQAAKIPNMEINIVVTLEEIFNGKNICDTIKRVGPCNDCNCTGFADKKIHKCDKCKGNGQCIELIQMGPTLARMMAACSKCNGSGSYDEHAKKCKKCNGHKAVNEMYNLKYTLGRGVLEDNYVIISNEGNHGLINGKSKRGDIVLVIHISEHPTYKIINKYNLEMTLELQLVEALCGTVKSFKFLDGNDIYIDLTEPVNNGDIKVLNEYGLPHANSTYKCGELYIKCIIVFPDRMDEILKGKVYSALTDKPYNYGELHKMPEDVHPVQFEDAVDTQNDDSSEEGQRDGGVQCAQQ